MGDIVPLKTELALPAVIEAAGDQARRRFLEFFTVNIRNPNTRRTYGRASASFLLWCEERGLTSLQAIEPFHVAAWIEALGQSHSVPTVKARLAAGRHLFDWLVVGQVMPTNPAASVRGPKHIVRRGKTAVLDPAEARVLLDAIDVAKPIGLRDRALIGFMVYSCARIGAALSMRIGDVYTQNRRLWVRLHEKGGKRHEMPCHHNLESYLSEYLAHLEACGLAGEPRAWLIPTLDRESRQLSGRPLPQANAWAMIRRRARQAGIETAVCNHTFRATGITAYLKNAGTLEKAAQMASHAPPPGRRSSTTVGMMSLAWMRWSEFWFECSREIRVW